MADKQESPTLDGAEPKPPETPPPAAAAQPNQYSELVAELERFGVKSTEQLQGKLAAAQQVGNMGNILGEVRKENEELKRFIREQMEGQKRQAKPADSWDAPPQEHSAGTIDLADLVGKQVKKVFDDEKRQVMQQQQAVWQAWNRIQGDPDFPVVRDKWEAKLKDPNFAIKIQAGQIDPVAEYQELLRSTYKDAITRSAEIIKSLTTGTAPLRVHVEGSARVSGMKTEVPDDKEKLLNPLREKVNKGKVLSEEEELKALMRVLGGSG